MLAKLRYFLALIICVCALAQSSEPAHKISNKKYDLTVGTIFKNEAPYLKEWLEYHLLVGVEHFYLYNNGSTDRSVEVLQPYVDAGIITLTDWPDQNPQNLPKDTQYLWVYTTQVPACLDAVKKANGVSEWIALIDVDEFLVSMNTYKFTDLLEKYKEQVALTVPWHMYGTSYFYEIPPDTLMIEIMHLVSNAKDPANIHNAVYKSVFKPDRFLGFAWPPHRGSYVDKQPHLDLAKSEARLNHYTNHDIHYFLNTKVKNKEHMDNRKLSSDELMGLLSVGNNIEDAEKPCAKYVPELRKRMGFTEQRPNQEKKIVYITPGYWGNLFGKNHDGTDYHSAFRQMAADAGYDVRQAGSLDELDDFTLLIVYEIFPDQLEKLAKFPKEKLVLMLWEPPSVLPNNYNKEYHEIFSKIYTWNDDLVDDKRYFKFYYPVMQPMIPDVVAFNDKKLASLVISNKYSSHPNELYSERKKLIQFFEQNHPNDFALYGKGWSEENKTYKGSVARKEDVLKLYKFSFAYENIKDVPGYITEKIFDCFHAGTVPVYFGASNISSYIPKECYIDRTQYASNEDLYNDLANMDEKKYNRYLDNIRQYLDSGPAQKYSQEYFTRTMMNIITVP